MPIEMKVKKRSISDVNAKGVMKALKSPSHKKNKKLSQDKHSKKSPQSHISKPSKLGTIIKPVDDDDESDSSNEISTPEFRTVSKKSPKDKHNRKSPQKGISKPSKLGTIIKPVDDDDESESSDELSTPEFRTVSKKSPKETWKSDKKKTLKRTADEMEDDDTGNDAQMKKIKKFKGIFSLNKGKQQKDSEDESVDDDEEEEDEDSDEEEEDEDSDEEDFKTKLKSQLEKMKGLKMNVDEEDDDDDDNEDGEDDDEEEEEDDEDDSDDDEEEDDDEGDSDDDDDDDKEEDDRDESEDPKNIKETSKKKTQSRAVPYPPKDLNYLVLCGLDSSASVPEVRNFLSRRSLPIETVSLVPGLTAVIGVEPANVNRVIEKMDGTNYKSSTLTAIRPANQKSIIHLAENAAKGTLSDKTTLHVRGLPKEATEEHIRLLFPNKDEIVDINMLYKRGSNVFRGLATVKFTSEEEATKGMEAANGAKMAERFITVSYNIVRTPGGSQQSGGRSGEELKGKTSTMMLSCLPDEVNYAMIKKVVSGGIQYDLKGTGNFKRCFIAFETPSDCSDAFQRSKGGKISGTPYMMSLVQDRSSGFHKNERPGTPGGAGGRRGDISQAYSPCMALFNLPFAADENSVRELYSGDIEKVVFPKQGMCVVKFDSTESCQEALDMSNDLQMDGRKLRAESRDEGAITFTPQFGGRGRGGRGRGFGDRGHGGRGRDRGGFRGRGGGRYFSEGRGGGGGGGWGRGRGRGSTKKFDSDSD